MKRLLVLNPFFFALLLYCKNAIGTEPPFPHHPLPEKLTISTSTHPAVTEHFQPWVKSAYDELGIETEFLMLNEQRALILLQNGELDGDIIRTEQVLSTLHSVLPVYMLGEARVYLVCRPRLDCNRNILSNPNLILGSVAGNAYFQQLLEGAQIAQMSYTTYQLLQQSYQQKRVDAFIEIRNSYESGKSFPQHAGIFELGHIRGFHLLHKKHQHLIPLIAEKLKSTANNESAHSHKSRVKQ